MKEHSHPKSKSGEHGGIAFAFLLLLALPFLFVFGAALATSVLSAGAPMDGISADDGSSDLTTSPLEAPSAPADLIPVGDLGTGGLVEVNLPNVYWPKVPALDRRVAPMLYGTIRAMEADGIRGVTYNSFFRSTAHQAAIQPVGTKLKARPGTSDHERGTAVDVAGMSTRSDAGRIVEHFRRSGFSWLGPRDRPHFYIESWRLGEADKTAFLKRQQKHYESGLWKK